MPRGGFPACTDFWLRACLVGVGVIALAVSAYAKDPGQDDYMIRMLSCTGPDATMEVYIPQSIALEGNEYGARSAEAGDRLLHARSDAV